MKVNLALLKGAISCVISSVVVALGGVDSLLSLLVKLIVFDIITGIIKAARRKELSSREMFYGVVRKFLIFFIIALAVQIDVIISEYLKSPIQIAGYDIFLRTLFITYFSLEEFISLLENLCDIGVPFPKWLRGILIKVESTVSGETVPSFIVNYIKDKFHIDLNDKC
jgi:toxin secretion/phage lysis holin